MRPIANARLQDNVQLVLERMSALPSRSGIQPVVEGQTVVLRGAVADERERRLAEGVVRLTPGVREVRNELEVLETAPKPTPVP